MKNSFLLQIGDRFVYRELRISIMKVGNHKEVTH